MLVHPKALLATARAVASEAKRYALNAIKVSRKRGKTDPVVTTVATTGKWLFATSREEPDPDELPKSESVQGQLNHTKKPVEQLVDARAAVEAAKAVSPKNHIMATRFVGVGDGDAPGAFLESWKDGEPVLRKSPVIEGHFPSLDTVYPEVSQETHYVVSFDAAILADVLKAFLELERKRPRNEPKSIGEPQVGIRVFFSKERMASQPVVVHGFDLLDGVKATAVVMPVGVDPDDETTYTEGRAEL